MYEDIKPTVRIGKKGVNDAAVEEIRSQLRTRKIVKIKFLQSADRGNMRQKAEELADMCGATVEKVIGFTVILRKK